MIDFSDLTACLWPIASMPRPDLERVREAVGLHSDRAIVVESCQRLEAYAFEDCQCAAPARLRGRDAILHLAAVAAGLHSAVLGEEQVMGQVRTALADSPRALREAGDIAVAAARELRQKTQVDSDSGHLLDRGLMLANAASRGTVLILGTGHMARLIARRALQLGFERVVIGGRSRPEGAWFDERSFAFVELHDVHTQTGIDITVGCLGANAPVIDVERELPPVSQLILDLGTPRNFTGEATVPLLDIATLLEAGHRHTMARRERLLADLGEILDRRIAASGTTGQSPVGALRASIERVRQREVVRIRRLHPEIAAETVDAITQSLVNQIFHLPSQRLSLIEDPETRERLALLFCEDGYAPHPGRDS